MFRHFFLYYFSLPLSLSPAFQHAIVLFQLAVKSGHLLAILDFYHLQGEVGQ